MMRVRVPIAWPLAGGGHLAHHEAGHLVVAHCLGMATGNAIVRGSVGFAAVGMGTRPPAPVQADTVPRDQPARLVSAMLDASYPTYWPGKTKHQAGIDYATMLTAGRQAELIEADYILSPGEYLHIHDSDHKQALELLTHLDYSRHSLGYCQHRSRRLLLDHWEQVETIAASLQEPA